MKAAFKEEREGSTVITKVMAVGKEERLEISLTVPYLQDMKGKMSTG